MILTKIVNEKEVLRQIPPRIPVGILGCGNCSAVLGTGGTRQVESWIEKLKSRNEVIFGSVAEAPCDQRLLRRFLQLVPGFSKARVILFLGCQSGAQSLAGILNKEKTGQELVLGVQNEGSGWISQENRQWKPCYSCRKCSFQPAIGKCYVADCPLKKSDGPCQNRVLGTEKSGKIAGSGNCPVIPGQACAWEDSGDLHLKAGRPNVKKRKTQSPGKWVFSDSPSDFKSLYKIVEQCRKGSFTGIMLRYSSGLDPLICVPEIKNSGLDFALCLHFRDMNEHALFSAVKSAVALGIQRIFFVDPPCRNEISPPETPMPAGPSFASEVSGAFKKRLILGIFNQLVMKSDLDLLEKYVESGVKTVVLPAHRNNLVLFRNIDIWLWSSEDDVNNQIWDLTGEYSSLKPF